MCNIRPFYWLRQLYEADFHKPGIYGSGRVCANAWDVVFRALSRGGRGRRVAVDFVVCFGWGELFLDFFFSIFFFSSNAHGLLQVWGRLASFTSLLVKAVWFPTHTLPWAYRFPSRDLLTDARASSWASPEITFVSVQNRTVYEKTNQFTRYTCYTER